ncbi:MAG: hypothetical protein ACREPM_10095 [Gemmatimonadaceae bacterium]
MALLPAMSVVMIALPVVVEVEYLRARIVLVSPPLLATFLAGFVGLGLSRRRFWRTSLPAEHVAPGVR